MPVLRNEDADSDVIRHRVHDVDDFFMRGMNERRMRQRMHIS